MKHFEGIVGFEHDGARLDRALADMNPDVSRSEIQRDILAGRVSVDDAVVTQRSYRVRDGERLRWESTSKPVLDPRPLDLEILFEDEHIVVVDKPIGLVVHPGAGTKRTTLVEGLLVDRNLPPSDDPTRPGIVHRLDKDTSGVLLVAKTPEALRSIQAQFAARTTSKTYVAVVRGVVTEEEGWIDAPIGRDPRVPSQMAVQPGGRHAQTGFSVLRRMDDATLLVVRPRTGRTHQIRVHCRYIDHPVTGDRIYGGAGGRAARPGAPEAGTRLMLHAWRLEIEHPVSGERVRFEAPIPAAFPDASYDDVPWSVIPVRK